MPSFTFTNKCLFVEIGFDRFPEEAWKIEPSPEQIVYVNDTPNGATKASHAKQIVIKSLGQTTESKVNNT